MKIIVIINIACKTHQALFWFHKRSVCPVHLVVEAWKRNIMMVLTLTMTMIMTYRTRVPFCCFGMTRNVKRGPESTIWMVDPSGRSTYLLMWMCWLAVPFVVSAPFDDKICWYGQAFRINILCNRPILLMEQICATVVVQFLQCSLHCAMWPVYICKGLLGQYYCIVCLFLHVLLEFGAIVVSLGWVKIWKVGWCWAMCIVT